MNCSLCSLDMICCVSLRSTRFSIGLVVSLLFFCILHSWLQPSRTFIFFANLKQNALTPTLLLPVVVPRSNLVQNRRKILIWLHCLLLWWFLIQSLFKIDAKCSSGCLAYSRGGFFLNSYSKLMQRAHLAALPPTVVVSYSIIFRIWCRKLI